MLKTIFIGYLILMSLFTLFLFGIDKQKARHQAENTGTQTHILCFGRRKYRSFIRNILIPA